LGKSLEEEYLGDKVGFGEEFIGYFRDNKEDLKRFGFYEEYEE
jgi:hypothetical protein